MNNRTSEQKCHKCGSIGGCCRDGVLNPCENCINIEKCNLCDADGMCLCCADGICKNCIDVTAVTTGTYQRCERMCNHTTCKHCKNTSKCCSNKCSHGTCATCEYFMNRFSDTIEERIDRYRCC